MNSTCTQAAVDPNDKHRKAIKDAEGKIQDILTALADDTGCDIDYVEVDTRNFSNLRPQIGLR